jgi:zinc/manganese transport system substrate-binding protein
MKTIGRIFGLLLLATLILAGCGKAGGAAAGKKRTIVATYSVLASIVGELAGGAFTVITSIPNGLDPHEWEPSAKDIEALMKADVVVENGIGLEGGMEKTLQKVRASGVKLFTASSAITVRTVKAGEGIPSGDPDQASGAEDPHLWLDPVAMKEVVGSLAAYLKSTFGVDLTSRASVLSNKLDALDAEIRSEVSQVPVERRRLVTGHESMGYFAQRYGFKLAGAIIPSLSTQAEVSAAQMSALRKLILENHVPAVFTELGTPPAVAETLAREAHVKAISLTTHSLPADGSYFTFMRDIARTITEGLQ